MKVFRLALLTAALAALSLTTRAEDPPPVAPGDVMPDAPPEVTKAAADIALAVHLVEYGRDNKLPEALVTAALILHKTPAGDDLPDLAAEFKPAPLPKPADLLAEAGKLRPDDKSLAAVIARASDEIKEAPRGAVNGPKRFSGTTSASFAVAFKPNQLAHVHVAGTKKIKGPGPFGKMITLPAAVKLTVTGPKGEKVFEQSGPLVTWNAMVKGTVPQTYRVTVTHLGGTSPTIDGSTN